SSGKRSGGAKTARKMKPAIKAQPMGEALSPAGVLQLLIMRVEDKPPEAESQIREQIIGSTS
ncbi:MAG: hypothetical protein WCI75_11095, partial [candidate division NC10 bacterium]